MTVGATKQSACATTCFLLSAQNVATKFDSNRGAGKQMSDEGQRLDSNSNDVAASAMTKGSFHFFQRLF